MTRSNLLVLYSVSSPDMKAVSHLNFMDFSPVILIGLTTKSLYLGIFALPFKLVFNQLKCFLRQRDIRKNSQLVQMKIIENNQKFKNNFLGLGLVYLCI